MNHLRHRDFDRPCEAQTLTDLSASRCVSLYLQPVRVATGSRDEESNLVFSDGSLVAILVRLSDQHADDAGKWFLEVGFGRVDHPSPPTFADLYEAQAWVEQRLTSAS